MRTLHIKHLYPYFFAAVITVALQLPASAQIELGGDAVVNPDDFIITSFAEDLNYPVGMAELSDGSILVALSKGTNFFGSTAGQLVRLADTDGDGVADEQTVLADNVPGGALTSVRIAGNLAFTTGQSRTISIYRLGATPTDPLSLAGEMDITYSGSWLHPHSALAARLTPGGNTVDLFFQLGSSENFAVTTRTLNLTSTFGLSEELVGDAVYRVQLSDDGTTLSASSFDLIALGLRNATGFDFHPETEDLYIADNGIDGLADANEPHSADELNVFSASDLGVNVIDYGFPSTYEAYRTGEQVGSTGVLPIVAFQPLPDPLTGSESEGPNDIAFAPAGFPEGLNNGVFVTFHGKFVLGGLENEENPLVFVDLDDNSYFHIIPNTLPDVGHLDGLLATEDALYVADISPDGGFGNSTSDTGVIYKIQAKSIDPTSIETPETDQPSLALYPNPMSDQLNINLPARISGTVTVSIYDVLGRQIRELFTGPQGNSQTLKWDGKNEEGGHVAPGVYFVVLQDQQRITTNAFILSR